MKVNNEDEDLLSGLMLYRSDDRAGLQSVESSTSVETAGLLNMAELNAGLVGGGGNPNECNHDATIKTHAERYNSNNINDNSVET